MRQIKFFILIIFSIVIFLSSLVDAANVEVNICTTDFLNIREEPSINGKPIISPDTKDKKRQLRIGDTVRVLKRTDNEETSWT